MRQVLTWRNALLGGALAFGLWGVAATVWLATHDGASPVSQDMKSVAVLPFANMSADPENEYFSDGITDDIITHLSKIADLTVISRTSVMRYKDTEKSIGEIGEELGVAAILEGGVRRSGDQVRINAQLIDVASDAHLWAEIYDRQLADVFAIQSDVAQQIAGALQATLTPAERERIEQRPTDDLAAYDYYLRGHAFFARTAFDNEALRESEELYRQAVTLDPQLAVAWAALSQVHSRYYWSYIDRTPQRVAMAREAFERAFQIEPTLPAGHVAAGMYHYYTRRDYESALREFEAALASEPNNAEALEGAAWVYRRLGEWDRAASILKRVVELDPQSVNRLLTAGETLYYTRRYDDAERYLLRALALQPGEAQALRLRAWIQVSQSGDIQQGRSLTEAALDATTQGAFPGGDDLQPWWFMRALGDDTGGLLSRITPATFADDSVNYWMTVAELEDLRGQSEAARVAYASAAEILERQVAADPEDARYHSELGVVLVALGRPEEAIREARRATELLPLERDALWARAFIENLALVYARAGRAGAAIDLLERSLELSGPLTPAWLQVDPAWDGLRNNARFQGLLTPGSAP
jgi:TolB-like protein/Tfp pilus assembly protein PilF